MTVAEIERYIEGAVWRMKSKAQFDYTLANLIGVSVARIMSKDAEYPAIEDVYSGIFAEEIEQKKREEENPNIENSVNHFLAFAMAHNARMKGVENKDNDN